MYWYAKYGQRPLSSTRRTGGHYKRRCRTRRTGGGFNYPPGVNSLAAAIPKTGLYATRKTSGMYHRRRPRMGPRRSCRMPLPRY